MPKLAEQRNHLLLVDRCHNDAWRYRTQAKAGGGGMSEQRGSLRLVRHAYVATGWADPNASVVATYVVDQIGKGLRYAGGGVLLQPGSDVLGRPTLVERPPQRCCAEPVNTRAAPRLLIGQHPHLVRHRVLQRSGRHRGQIVLDHELLDGSREQLSERGWHRLTGL